jgi:hypothetical protein
MRPYIYVVAYQDEDGVAFHHVQIEAADDDDAYAVGGRVVDGVTLNGPLLNDYVIALAPALRAVS